MKVIDYNPAERVPPIMESDIDSKIIISVTNIDKSYSHFNYFSYIKKDHSGLFHFHGINLKYLQGSYQWTECENTGKTIIELLINEYNAFPANWNIIYLVVESELELIDLLAKYHVNESMSNELSAYWKSLRGRSTQ